MYAVTTTDEYGIHYLINHWNKYRAFFLPYFPIFRDQFYVQTKQV